MIGIKLIQNIFKILKIKFPEIKNVLKILKYESKIYIKDQV